MPAPARAQIVSGGEMAYIGSGLCVSGKTQISPYGYLIPFGLYANTVVSTYSSCPKAVGPKQYMPCIRMLDDGCLGNPVPPAPAPAKPWVARSMPVGSLAITQALYLDVNGTKQFCSMIVGWQTNNVAEASMSYFGGAAGSCGFGTYGVSTGVFAWDGTTWQGAWFWTGDLFLF
jgi:hypothetical protein